MKNIARPILLLSVLFITAFCKKGTTNKKPNARPLVTLKAELVSASPYTFRFTAEASDADNDPLTYTWAFGEGTIKKGGTTETFSYEDNKEFIISISVTDNKTTPAEASTQIDTKLVSVEVDNNKKYQTIEGFGGFGAMNNYWTSGPFTSPAFVNTLINDLGLSILRDDIPSNFEIVNDNADPMVTELSKFNLNNNTAGIDGKLADHLGYLKDMHAAGLEKLIVSIWSAPPWMKTNNRVNNGTSQNAAPPYNPNPTSADNQLRTDMYEEFSEMCIAYVRVIKQETGIDLYALSIQNEPRFSQFYASCVYNGAALRDLIKVVGKRFKDAGLSTKLFLPEDIGWLGGVESMIKPTLDDPQARQYVDIVAVHGYDLDGVTANSPNAQTWQTMYQWGAVYGKPLWMTETSGFSNDWSGAMALSKAMYTALQHGNISAWLYWTLSTGTLDGYSLMSSAGEKSKRYYVSKNFYRYVRPGAVRIMAQAAPEAKVYPLGFKHDQQNSTTLVLINDNDKPKAIKLTGTGLPVKWQHFTTSASLNCAESGEVSTDTRILLPPNSVNTLYSRN